MEKIRLGFLGLGQRGNGLLSNVLNNFPEVEVVALCDEYADRVEDCIKRVEEKRGMRPTGTNVNDVAVVLIQ